MKIFKYFIVVLILFTVNDSFAQKKKKKNKTAVDVIVLEDFKPNSSITVMGGDKDPLMLRDLIESELMFSGSSLKIISPTAARKTISASNNIDVDVDLDKKVEGNINQQVEIQTEAVTTVASVYALTFRYTYNPNTGGLMNFTGQIINMRDGAVLVKFRRQNSSSFGLGVAKAKLVSAVVAEIIRLSE